MSCLVLRMKGGEEMPLCLGRKYSDDVVIESHDMEKAVTSTVKAAISSLPKDARRYDVVKDVLEQAQKCLDRIPIEFFPDNK